MYPPKSERRAAPERANRYPVEARILRLIRATQWVRPPSSTPRRSESLVIRIRSALRTPGATRSWQP